MCFEHKNFGLFYGLKPFKTRLGLKFIKIVDSLKQIYVGYVDDHVDDSSSFLYLFSGHIRIRDLLNQFRFSLVQRIT